VSGLHAGERIRRRLLHALWRTFDGSLSCLQWSRSTQPALLLGEEGRATYQPALTTFRKLGASLDVRGLEAEIAPLVHPTT
jgi:hypothetical protein